MHISAIALLLSVLFTGSVASCNKGKKGGSAEESASKELIMNNVKYGSDSTQSMDIYLPANRNTDDTKTLVFIHGGSWSGGDKSEFNSAIQALRPQLPDYAFVNINYRLAYNGRNRFPAQINDIQSALDHLKKNADDYSINTNKLALIGASAGAHLALLQAYKHNKDGNIKAVVDLFGPADLTDLYYNHPVPAGSQPTLVNLLGATPATNSQLYKDATPVSFINSQTVPTKIFHGAGDYIVPITQSNSLKTKLQANNVKVEMTVYKREGHGWYGPNLVDTYTKTVRFIKENVK